MTEAADHAHVTYVLRCADGTLYTGYTTELARRVAEHDAGEGAKYTRGRTPVELVHAEGFATRSAAMSREYEIKDSRRGAKERLVAGDRPAVGEPIDPSTVGDGGGSARAGARADGDR